MIVFNQEWMMATMQTLLTCVHPRAYRHDNTLHTRTNTPRQGTVSSAAAGIYRWCSKCSTVSISLNIVTYKRHINVHLLYFFWIWLITVIKKFSSRCGMQFKEPMITDNPLWRTSQLLYGKDHSKMKYISHERISRKLVGLVIYIFWNFSKQLIRRSDSRLSVMMWKVSMFLCEISKSIHKSYM